MNDRILLTGVRATGFHGVLPEERERGQEFVVDLELSLPLAAAAATDRVAATVHYGRLAERVAAAVGRDPVDLIETLAERLADLALEDPLVAAVAVTVHKPSAPIPVPFGDVAVRLDLQPRSRPSRSPPRARTPTGRATGTGCWSAAPRSTRAPCWPTCSGSSARSGGSAASGGATGPSTST